MTRAHEPQPVPHPLASSKGKEKGDNEDRDRDLLKRKQDSSSIINVDHNGKIKAGTISLSGVILEMMIRRVAALLTEELVFSPEDISMFNHDNTSVLDSMLIFFRQGQQRHYRRQVQEV